MPYIFELLRPLAFDIKKVWNPPRARFWVNFSNSKPPWLEKFLTLGPMRLVDRKLHAKFHQNRTIFDGVMAKKRKIKAEIFMEILEFNFWFFDHNSVKNDPILMIFFLLISYWPGASARSSKTFLAALVQNFKNLLFHTFKWNHNLQHYVWYCMEHSNGACSCMTIPQSEFCNKVWIYLQKSWVLSWAPMYLKFML